MVDTLAKPAATRGDDVNRSVEPIFELFAVESHTGQIETGLNYYPHISVDITVMCIFLRFCRQCLTFLSTILQYL